MTQEQISCIVGEVDALPCMGGWKGLGSQEAEFSSEPSMEDSGARH